MEMGLFGFSCFGKEKKFGSNELCLKSLFLYIWLWLDGFFDFSSGGYRERGVMVVVVVMVLNQVIKTGVEVVR